MKKRNLCAEISEGFDALTNARSGKQALCTHEVEMYPAPAFASIKQGLQEAIAHAQGDERGVRVHRPRDIDVKAVRAKVGMVIPPPGAEDENSG